MLLLLLLLLLWSLLLFQGTFVRAVIIRQSLRGGWDLLHKFEAPLLFGHDLSIVGRINGNTHGGQGRRVRVVARNGHDPCGRIMTTVAGW